MRVHVILAAASATFVLLCGAFTAAAQPVVSAKQVWGDPRNGMRMAISAATSGSLLAEGAEILVVFENVGSSAVVLHLGEVLGGSRQHPRAIQLFLTDPKGATKELQSTELIGLIGSIEPFLVPVPVGGQYVLRLNLSRYFHYANGVPVFEMPAGRYQLAARLSSWVGRLESNQLPFDVAVGKQRP